MGWLLGVIIHLSLEDADPDRLERGFWTVVLVLVLVIVTAWLLSPPRPVLSSAPLTSPAAAIR